MAGCQSRASQLSLTGSECAASREADCNIYHQSVVISEGHVSCRQREPEERS